MVLIVHLIQGFHPPVVWTSVSQQFIHCTVDMSTATLSKADSIDVAPTQHQEVVNMHQSNDARVTREPYGHVGMHRSQT